MKLGRQEVEAQLFISYFTLSHFTSLGFNLINQQPDAENIYWVPIMGQVLC